MLEMTHRTKCLLSCFVLTMVVSSGCRTASVLRRNTVRQADTVADIHQQQVLDNLAKFINDPYAIPSFAHATSGVDMLTDSASASASPNFVEAAASSLGLTGTASRANQNSWTLTPVTNPRQLELMRCAYQRVISQCGCGFESPACPDCRKRFNQFYTGTAVGVTHRSFDDACFQYDIDGNATNRVSGPVDRDCLRFGDCKCPGENGENVTPGTFESCGNCSTQSAGNGIVNSECLNAPCWLCWGNKKCVPKDCKYVGHHCGTYVWVPCGPGRNELAKLTLAILDYAVNEAQQVAQKEVTFYFDNMGKLAQNEKEAAVSVRAMLPVGTPSSSLLRHEHFDPDYNMRRDESKAAAGKVLNSARSVYNAWLDYGNEVKTLSTFVSPTDAETLVSPASVKTLASPTANEVISNLKSRVRQDSRQDKDSVENTKEVLGQIEAIQLAQKDINDINAKVRSTILEDLKIISGIEKEVTEKGMAGSDRNLATALTRVSGFRSVPSSSKMDLSKVERAIQVMRSDNNEKTLKVSNQAAEELVQIQNQIQDLVQKRNLAVERIGAFMQSKKDAEGSQREFDAARQSLPSVPLPPRRPLAQPSVFNPLFLQQQLNTVTPFGP